MVVSTNAVAFNLTAKKWQNFWAEAFHLCPSLVPIVPEYRPAYEGQIDCTIAEFSVEQTGYIAAYLESTGQPLRKTNRSFFDGIKRLADEGKALTCVTF